MESWSKKTQHNGFCRVWVKELGLDKLNWGLHGIKEHIDKDKNHYAGISCGPRRLKILFMNTDQYIRVPLHATVFSSPLFSLPLPSYGDFYTLYRLFLIIWTLHLLIIWTPTCAPIPSDTHFSLLWVAAAKATLFKGLLHINAARKVAAVHLMWWWQLFLK